MQLLVDGSGIIRANGLNCVADQAQSIIGGCGGHVRVSAVLFVVALDPFGSLGGSRLVGERGDGVPAVGGFIGSVAQRGALGECGVADAGDAKAGILDSLHDQSGFIGLGNGDQHIAAGILDLSHVGSKVLLIIGELLNGNDLDAVVRQSLLDNGGDAGAQSIRAVQDRDLGSANGLAVQSDGNAGAGIGSAGGQQPLVRGGLQLHGRTGANGGDLLVGNEGLHSQHHGGILVQNGSADVIFGDQFLIGVGSGSLSALVVFVNNGHRAAQNTAGSVDVLQEHLGAFPGILAIHGAVTGECVQQADHDGLIGLERLGCRGGFRSRRSGCGSRLSRLCAGAARKKAHDQ